MSDTYIAAGRQDPRNEYVASVVDRLVKAVLAELEPQAIVLYGSFGRGEGSVGYEGGRPRLISDIELAVVPRSFAGGLRARSIVAGLRLPEGVDASVGVFTPERFTRIRARNWPFGRSVLTLEQYELLTASRVLSGSLPAGAVDVGPATICPWDGPRLVFNRSVELVEALVAPADAVGLQKAVTKLLIACGDALLLGAGRYSSSYRERGLAFREYCAESLPAPIAKRIADAYAWKLEPTTHVAEVALSDLVSSALLPTLAATMPPVLGTDVLSSADFRQRYLESERLPEMCRSSPGSPALQSALLFCLRAASRTWPFPLRGAWLEVHEVYADAVEWLVSAGEATSDELSKDTRTTGRAIVSAWHRTGYRM